MATVAELGEGPLIKRFQSVLPVGERTLLGSGDDAAQVSAPEGSFIVSTDMLVDGSHFKREWSTAAEIGARAAAQNLADIAGMGGVPSALVVAMSLPGDTDADWIVDLAAGMGDRAAKAGAGVIGGDLTEGDLLTIAVTVMGYCPQGVVTRAGAQAGDTIAIAGTLGWSAAGLALLDADAVDPLEHDSSVLGDVAPFLATYRAPDPPLEAGLIGARHGARAMMDVSDGLALDATRMAKASGVRIDLDPAALRAEAAVLEPAMARLRESAMMDGLSAGLPDPMEWVTAGGEDHSILAAFPPHVLPPAPFRAIGVATAIEPGGEPRVLVEGRELHGGWDHFHA